MNGGYIKTDGFARLAQEEGNYLYNSNDDIRSIFFPSY